MPPHTLNIRNRLCQDILLRLWVFETREDLLLDRLDKVCLLRLALLSLVSDPAVEGGLHLSCEVGFLAEDKGVVL